MNKLWIDLLTHLSYTSIEFIDWDNSTSSINDNDNDKRLRETTDALARKGSETDLIDPPESHVVSHTQK